MKAFALHRDAVIYMHTRVQTLERWSQHKIESMAINKTPWKKYLEAKSHQEWRSSSGLQLWEEF
jgi:hypothetical protein